MPTLVPVDHDPYADAGPDPMGGFGYGATTADGPDDNGPLTRFGAGALQGLMTGQPMAGGAQGGNFAGALGQSLGRQVNNAVTVPYNALKDQAAYLEGHKPMTDADLADSVAPVVGMMTAPTDAGAAGVAGIGGGRGGAFDGALDALRAARKTDNSATLAPFQSAATTLPMDQASRYGRAEKMGFDTSLPLYHGTATPFQDQFKIGDLGAAYFSADPEIANTYTERSGSQVVPVFVRMSDPMTHDAGGALLNRDDHVALVAQAKAAGHDGLIVRNVDDGGGTVSNPRSVIQDQYAVFDPKNIRSRSALFDPAQSSSAKLLAAGGVSLPAQQPVTLVPVDHNPYVTNDGRPAT